MSVQQLSAVFERSRSRGGARLVLLSIANHDGDGGSWPTISTICRESGLCENTVHAAIKRLQADGELKVHVQSGGTRDCPDHHRPNSYQIVLPPPILGTPPPPESSTPPPPSSGTQTTQEPPKNRPSRAAVDQGFNLFWAEYPKKTAKRSALLAYERALGRARRTLQFPIEMIRDAAARYAKAVEGTDPQYIKNPTTWLNGDCWEDRLTPQRSSSSTTANGMRYV